MNTDISIFDDEDLLRLITKLYSYGYKSILPRFKISKSEDGIFTSELNLPGIKKAALGIDKDITCSLINCVHKMIMLLEEKNNRKNKNTIEKDYYCEDCEDYFGDIECDPNYTYRYCSGDVFIPHQDILRKLLNHYAEGTVKAINNDDEEIDKISEIVTVRLLLKKRKSGGEKKNGKLL